MGKWIRYTPRAVGAILALAYFTTNVALASVQESNFWTERNRTLRKQNRSGDLVALADLHATSGLPTDLLRQFPSLDRGALSPALSQTVTENLPHDFVKKHAAILTALPYSFGTARHIALPDGGNFEKIVVHIQDVH